MAMLEKEPLLAEVLGVPTFFVTEIITESAGGGCVRLYGCIRQRGLLIPQYQAIFPAAAMIASAKAAAEGAVSVLHEEFGLSKRMAH